MNSLFALRLRPAIALLLITTLTACAVAASTSVTAQAPKQRIEKAADLPTFTYPVQGDLAALVRDDARFKPLSKLIARDYSGVDTLVATYSAYLKANQIVERGSSDDIYNRPQHAYTRQLLGAIPKGHLVAA